MLYYLDKCGGSVPPLMGVTIRWIGPLDWTTGLDYWNGNQQHGTGVIAHARRERLQGTLSFFEQHGLQGEFCILSSWQFSLKLVVVN